MANYIFYSCDQWKSKGSRQAKFIFSDSHIDLKKVLKYIEQYKDEYFDEDGYEIFFNYIKEYGIFEAIKDVNQLYATIEEIQTIKELQY